MRYPTRHLFIVVFAFVTTAATASVQTDSITLAWAPNAPSEQVTQYRLYYKTGPPGQPYKGTGLDQGNSPIIIRVADLADENNPRFGLSGLAAGVTYRFVITAFNDIESPYSNEFSHPIVKRNKAPVPYFLFLY